MNSTTKAQFCATEFAYDGRIETLHAWGAGMLALYLLAIPHTDADGTLTGDAAEFQELVCPVFPVTASEIAAMFATAEYCGLLVRYTDAAGNPRLAFSHGDLFLTLTEKLDDEENGITGIPARFERVRFGALRGCDVHTN